MTTVQDERGTELEQQRHPPLTVTKHHLTADEWERALRLDAPLVVLPKRRTPTGEGVYPETTVFLVKELRAAGLSAVYADPSESRRFEVKKSALTDALFSVVLGISSGVGSTAVWAGAKALLHRNHPGDEPLELTYTSLSQDGDRTAWTVRGRADEVLEAVDKLRRSAALDELEP